MTLPPSSTTSALYNEPAHEGATGTGAVPIRSEVPLADTWDLTRLYPDLASWEADFQEIKERYPKVEEYRGRLGESAQTVADCLEFEKAIDLKIERLYHFANLRVSEDSTNNEALTLETRLRGMLTELMAAFSFVTPELQAIDDATFDAWLEEPVLADWKIRLRKIRRMKPHVLSESEERLLALSSHSLHGHQQTFSQLTNVDMQFGELEDADGTKQPLTQSSFIGFLESSHPDVRRRAFHQFYDEFESHAYTLSSTFAGSIRADVFSARARNFGSALEASLFPDAITVDIYENLLATVHEYLPALHDYYELRRQLLGLDEMHHYDCYVPLIKDQKTDYSFDAAIDLVCDALHPLGNEYVDNLREGLRNGRWVDRYENKGKRSGAFSSSSYGNPPFILMNYKRQVFGDVYTLAHEAGHSMHTWYSQRKQPYQNYDYPIFLAEVASTFNEELLTHDLLKKNEDPKFRAMVINRQIDDIRGTLFRQTMFAEFERDAHALEESGDGLTLEGVRAVYRKLLDAYFGPKFVIDDQLELECLRIPHFYSSFYVYKYATGVSAAVALSERVLKGGDSERQDYLTFLESGGSRFPLDTLQLAGVDLSQPDPIRATLELFKTRVAELQALLKTF